MDEYCKNCGGMIEIAIFKGTGYCCEWCKRGIARFRPDETIDVPLFEVHDGAGNSIGQIDLAKVITEPDLDLNDILMYCYEEHVDLSQPDEVGQAFVHQGLNRICINLYKRDVWVYSPEWEEFMRQYTHEHEHEGHEGHTH